MPSLPPRAGKGVDGAASGLLRNRVRGGGAARGRGSTSSCRPGSGRGGRDHRPARQRQGPPLSPAGTGSRDASPSAQESPAYTGSGRTPCRPDLASSKTAVGIRPPPDAAGRAIASGWGGGGVLSVGGGGGWQGAGESAGGAPGLLKAELERLVADLGLDAAASRFATAGRGPSWPPRAAPPAAVATPRRRSRSLASGAPTVC